MITSMLKRTIVLLCTGAPLMSGAQDAEKVTPLRIGTEFTDPCPTDFAPVGISYTEAASELSKNAAKAGFAEVFISKEDIEYLLYPDKAVGIRFYNAIDDKAAGTVRVVAVAVKADGSEINPLLSKSYRLTQPLSVTGISMRSISGSTAKTYVGELCSRVGLVPFTAFYTATNLKELLRFYATGIKLIPASRKFTVSKADGTTEVKTYNTMMGIGVTTKNQTVSTIGYTYRKSLEPCPYFCPNDKYLLMPARY